MIGEMSEPSAIHSPMPETHKSALVVAYFLSRCDKKGVQALGYQTWGEAYAQIGHKLNVLPTTIKQMRDSFDPYCSPVRKGWHQRSPLRSRVLVMEAYSEVSSDALFQIAQEIIAGTGSAAAVYVAPLAAIGPIDKSADLLADNLAFAARLRTGEAAEEYFKLQYSTLPQFAGLELEDTRKLGTGFDFRVRGPGILRAVEVKGVIGHTGSIAFTDKEWSVANYLKHDYILALVRSLQTTPTLELMADPAASLPIIKRSIETVSVYWSAKV